MYLIAIFAAENLVKYTVMIDAKERKEIEKK
jgi:hypothetical protein